MPTANRLTRETSPYLRQHADNPVDWYPWGDEAFAEAGRRDVPVLLSIGYSACHWCHVMAHECFEHDQVADVINSLFVNIKVDREERPDVDTIYMEAVQAITGGGGWPMTVFLLPDGRPFHGGTYYPRDLFLDLIARIDRLWKEKRSDLEQAAEQLAQAVRSGTTLPNLGRASTGAAGPPTGVAGAGPSPDLLAITGDALLARHDPDWGGFGRAPKFPQPPMLETLLTAATVTGRPDLLQAAVTTLDAMAVGGIYDHLGGGFSRYSTDRTWLVPHFEKMLYDNALLARVYLHGWQATALPRYRQVVTETLDYLLASPMRIPGAGLASAEDADSEGVEGKFYVWTLGEVAEVGGPAAVEWYGVTSVGNWEGRNILRRPLTGPLERPAEVEEARRTLLVRRAERIRPGLDDKVLTEWNAMAVSALAECGAALDRPDWVGAAVEIAEFLLASSRRPDGRWLRSWQGGVGRHLAYAGDHAWLVDAFTRLAEATGDPAWLDRAREVADALIDLFWEPALSAFAATGRDAEALIARPVDTQDGALPSANSVAATALLRLAALSGFSTYQDHAAALVDAMGAALGAAPIAFTGMVTAAHLASVGTTEIVVTGERPDLLEVVRRRHLPEAVVAWGTPYNSPLWEGRTGEQAAGYAYVCHHYTCRIPSADPASLDRDLQSIHPSGRRAGHYE